MSTTMSGIRSGFASIRISLSKQTRVGLIIVGTMFAGVQSKAASPADVERAIKQGVKYLYSVQSEDGNWDFILKPNDKGLYSGGTKQACGPTALAVYALLSAGESPTDPRIEKALAYLKKTPSAGSYAIGFRANVYAMLPPTPDTKRLMAAEASWLKSAMIMGKDIKTRGFYGYGAGVKTGHDRSTSQIAVLGSWGCAQVGDTFGPDYWNVIEVAWKKAQLEDGGWNYADTHNSGVSMSMTASGVATLFITQEYLHVNDYSECKGSANDINIERGLTWMGEHFAMDGAQPYYTLFAIERCGAASGYKTFGMHDWFKEGSDWLIEKQNKETGAWGQIPESSFAVLFLAKGRAPVAMTKLQYTAEQVGEGANVPSPTGSNWNQRPRDVANICRWVGRQQERRLNFQIASIESPIESLQESPVLYISGNQPLKFSDEKLAKLRRYIEDGGMIVGNADCSNKLFTESFKKLGTKLFPSYEFRVVPADHAMFEQFPYASWKNPPNIMTLGNGAREFMVLFPSGDPGKFWQLHQVGGKEEMHQVMADVLGYAIERDLTVRYKGDTYLVNPDAAVTADRTMKVARLQYAGNWDPEPGSWRRMGAILHNEQQMDITTEPVMIGEGKLDASYNLAHLTGTAAYKLSDKAGAELKAYVDGGGTLLVDACGGSSEFATEVETKLKAIFGGKLETLSPTHKMYMSEFPKQPKLSEVGYRAYARKSLGQAGKIPQLRGIEVKGRTAVIYSREDLSTGMVGHSVGGILGYSPKSATSLVQRILCTIAPPKPKKAVDPADPNAAPPETPPAPATEPPATPEPPAVPATETPAKP